MITQIFVLFLNLLPGSVSCDTSRTDSGIVETCLFTFDSINAVESRSVELNGKRHGQQVYFYPSGKLKRKEQYRHGLQIDTSRSFDEFGVMSEQMICDHQGDSCTSVSYLPDGRIRGGYQTRRGVSVGRSWFKYADGKWASIRERDELGRFHGLRASWDSLGRPIDSVIYLHDKILRGWWWYPNTSQLDNHWSYDSGDVVARRDTPRVLEAAYFGPDGKSQGKVVDGNGQLTSYFEGKLSGTKTYKAGVLVKSTHKYLDDGSLNPIYKKKGKR
jgi:antitoxin component YwqK of YwqJK toxin-antitoxin module